MYDIVVIGSGPGGYVAAIRASQLGFKTAVVEKAELGGICLNWGCIPTKALLKSAQALKYAEHAKDYGFSIDGQVKFDIADIVARSRGVSATMSKGIEFLFKKNKIDVIKGTAEIVSKGVINVKAEDGSVSAVEAKNIIVATGSRPNSLPFAPIDGKRIISYRQALVPETLPETLAVIGSGAIGSELAFFYSSLGVKVVLIEYLPQILPLEDEDTAAQISRSFKKIGMKIMTSAQVMSVDVSGEKCVLAVKTKKGEETVEADRVLSAVGVVPNTDGIGLENAGVVTERGRIKVDANYKAADGIYAIGDVIATPALAHVASAEAIACVEGIAGLDPEPVDYNNIPACTYVSPEVASVGYTEKALKEKGMDYKAGKFPFTASGKAVAAGERDGFVKLLVDPATDRILGAHLVGANVTEMLSGIVLARKVGATAKDIIKAVHPHPTMSEAIMEAASAVHDEAIHM